MCSEWFLIQSAAYRDGRSERIEVVARRSDEGAVHIVRASY